MSAFESIAQRDHEQVVFINLADTGLKAIVAIHNTTLGPALGGLRMWPYATGDEALEDVLRLSRSMTYKAAVAGLPLGGGKAVIIGDSKTDKSDALFRSFGQFVESLSGRYITAEDVGINVEDIEQVRKETEHAVGLPKERGGSGDPSPFTAYGTLQGIKACLEKRYGHQDLAKCSFAVQGIGHVGYNLVKLLHREGAKMFISDINDEALAKVADEFSAEAVSVDDIYNVKADVFVPCALGGVVNQRTIEQFQFDIVAGSANNQLENDASDELLAAKNILYAPDYVMNAGGLINVTCEREGYDRDKAYRLTGNIYDTIHHIFEIAERDGISTRLAADRLAEEHLQKAKRDRPYFNNQAVSALQQQA